MSLELGLRARLRAQLARRDDFDIRVHGLAPAQARSLRDARTAAAIVAEVDPRRGRVRVPQARNRVFRPVQIATVIREWQAAAGGAPLERSAPPPIVSTWA
jgi:hypothetical protein